MVTKEECEMMGGIYIPGYKKKDGTYVKAYCKSKTDKVFVKRGESHSIEPKIEWVPEVDDDLEVPDIPETPKTSNVPEISESQVIREKETKGENPITKKYKLPNSNLINAKMIEKDIASEDKYVKRDLKKQDFEDIPYQASRIAKDAEKEADESIKLEKSQQILSESEYAKLRNRIEKREAKETRERIKKESKMSKRSIKLEKKKRRHERREKRRSKKLERLWGRK